MRFSRPSFAAAATALLLQVTSAQNISVPPGSVMTHVIQVGDQNGGLKFYPDTLEGVNAGDLVQFHFWPKAHSVAQSSFDAPCQPLESANRTGFWSGMMPVAAESTTMPVFTIPINSTDPIWFYCATGRHCQSGMVGVINPPADKKLSTYISAAALVPTTGIPSGIGGGRNSTTPGEEGGANTTAPAGTSGTLSPTATGGADTGSAAALRIPGQAFGALVAVLVGALFVV